MLEHLTTGNTILDSQKDLKRMKVYDKKVAIENQFTDWVNSGDEKDMKVWKCFEYN